MRVLSIMICLVVLAAMAPAEAGMLRMQTQRATYRKTATPPQHVPASAQTVASRRGWASVPARADERMLPSTPPAAFTFAPDPSPVIIASLRSPDEPGNRMPPRNTNVYRPLAAKRQPAEITEKDPPLLPDLSAMRTGEDGLPRLTQVRLPGSAVGIGMATDYARSDWQPSTSPY